MFDHTDVASLVIGFTMKCDGVTGLTHGVGKEFVFTDFDSGLFRHRPNPLCIHTGFREDHLEFAILDKLNEVCTILESGFRVRRYTLKSSHFKVECLTKVEKGIVTSHQYTLWFRNFSDTFLCPLMKSF